MAVQSNTGAPTGGARGPSRKLSDTIDASADARLGCKMLPGELNSTVTTPWERYPGLIPPIPERIRRLEELAADLWWSWHYRARDLFRRLDYALWRGNGPQPGADAPADQPYLLATAAENRGFLDLRQRPARPRPGAVGQAHLVVGALRGVREGRAHRVFLGRVRAPPVAAPVRRRAGGARRRHLQGGERPRRAVCRRRLHVSAGLLPPAGHRRRLAAGNLRDASTG